MGFTDYVRSFKSVLENLNDSTKLCLVSGNETCDVDSIASALVYAHYIETTRNSVPEGTVTLPLIQCRREELVARMDAALLLEELGVQEEWLVFLDHITPEVLAGVGELSLVLVDHHEPAGMLSAFSSKVTMVIDHHQGTSPTLTQEGVVSTIELVGSCATLVSRKLLSDSSYEMEENVARALASVILSDTGKLLAEGRVTDQDKEAVRDLSKSLPSTFDNSKQYAKYMTAKFDISKLAVKEVLERDFKKESYGSRYVIGFCSITAKLSEYLTLPGAKEAIAEFYHTHSLSALVMFGVTIKTLDPMELEKQIAVYQPEGTHSEFTESLVAMLESNKDIRCERLEGLEEFEGVIMHQGNHTLSRKQMMPFFTEFTSSVDVLSPTAITTQLSEEGVGSSLTSDKPFPLEPTVNIISKTAVSMAKATGGAEGTSDGAGEGAGQSMGQMGRPRGPDVIPEYTAEEECKDRTYRYVNVGGDETVISMGMIEPYKKLVQHAGYVGETRKALLIISAAHLPSRSLPNYQHVLHHTFYYMLSMVDKLIVDDYMIVYFHSGAPRRSMPSAPMLLKLYKMIDRRLKKQLTKLYIVHPTFWVKCMIKLARPLLSKKFWRKVQFVPTLQELSKEVPVGEEYIPESVCARDDQIMATVQSDGRKKYESKEKDPEPSSSSQREEPAASTSTEKENSKPIAPTEEEIK